MKRIKQENFDYSGLIVLSKLKDMRTYRKYYYYINSGKCKKINTPMGIAINVEEFKEVIRQNQIKLSRTQINLQDLNKFNALYVRLDDMTQHNKIAVCNQSTKKIPRYQDEYGYTVINIMDYVEPQIKMLARKLNVRYSVVKKMVMGLIGEIYKEKNDNKII